MNALELHKEQAAKQWKQNTESSKRAEYAAMAMQAIVGSTTYHHYNEAAIARKAVKCADALLEELNNG